LSKNMFKIVAYHMFLRNYLLRNIEQANAPVLRNLKALAPDIIELRQGDDIDAQINRFNDED
jgi:hypothetical protein